MTKKKDKYTNIDAEYDEYPIEDDGRDVNYQSTSSHEEDVTRSEERVTPSREEEHSAAVGTDGTDGESQTSTSSFYSNSTISIREGSSNSSKSTGKAHPFYFCYCFTCTSMYDRNFYRI